MKLYIQKGKRKDKQILGYCQRIKKKLGNIRVRVITIIVGALGTVSKGLERRLDEKKIRGRFENIQTTLLRLARILIRTLET